MWRLITGPFVHPSILFLIFSLMSYMPTAVTQEKLDGTVKSCIRFFMIAFAIETLFVLSSFILAILISPDFMLENSIGLWPILFCDIVIEC